MLSSTIVLDGSITDSFGLGAWHVTMITFKEHQISHLKNAATDIATVRYLQHDIVPFES